MALTDLSLNLSYRSNRNDLVKDFFVPVLNETMYYRRAAGYFSSSVLEEIGGSINNICDKGGIIRVLCSPHLSDEDYTAIKRGYDAREHAKCHAILKEAMMNEICTVTGKTSVLELLSAMIATGYLDFKIACTSDYGLYHEKIGIMEDETLANGIAFSGSVNETGSAMCHNMESLDVYCSWRSEIESERVKEHKAHFDNMWFGLEPKIRVLEIPEVKDEFIKRFRRGSMHTNSFNTNVFDEDYKKENALANFGTEISTVKPKTLDWHIPSGLEFFDYQHEAINSWVHKGYRGIFEMATGTGKTLTALGAMMRLVTRNFLQNYGLMVVIACPYQHLVEQWNEDLKRFGIRAIVGYSGASDQEWFSSLERKVTLTGNPKNTGFYCFIGTNATLMSKRVRTVLRGLRTSGENLLIVDEAHNAGAAGFQSTLKDLDDVFSYRLALSATLERHHDYEGTAFIRDYFGQTCITYDIARAIREGKLTPYEYHPVVVSLNEKERKDYENITSKMEECFISDGQGGVKLNSYGQMLAIERARLISGIEGKLEALRELVINEELASTRDLLVYCGATSSERKRDISFENYDYVYESSSSKIASQENADNQERQILSVTRMLGNDFGMRVASFTANNSRAERQAMIEALASGVLQAIVAIKCLDEGVNIPSVKTAIILASTTNPKEYVQRRGRVLRRYPGKTHAVIYDMISLPYALEQIGLQTENERRIFRSLIHNEIRRCNEFAQLAINKLEGLRMAEKLAYSFGIRFEDNNDHVEHVI